jgi:hypothetical protein
MHDDGPEASQPGFKNLPCSLCDIRRIIRPQNIRTETRKLWTLEFWTSGFSGTVLAQMHLQVCSPDPTFALL